MECLLKNDILGDKHKMANEEKVVRCHTAAQKNTEIDSHVKVKSLWRILHLILFA